MTWLRGRWLPLTVGVAAAGLLIASIAWAWGGGWGPNGTSMMGPGAMMGPAISGDGQVRGLDDAERAAGRFAGRWGLTVGEVMQFDTGYYTLHTLRRDQIVGMLSVHASTGRVWYHSWHGRFITMNEH